MILINLREISNKKHAADVATVEQCYVKYSRNWAADYRLFFVHCCYVPIVCCIWAYLKFAGWKTPMIWNL